MEVVFPEFLLEVELFDEEDFDEEDVLFAEEVDPVEEEDKLLEEEDVAEL